MKAALMREYHQPLEFIERAVPEPIRATDVLIRIGGAGVCATDLHAIEGLMEPAGVTLPRVLGTRTPAGSRRSAPASRRSPRATRCSSSRRTAAACACRAAAASTCSASITSSPASRSTAASPTTCSCPSARSCALPAGVEPSAVAPHADAGLTAYHAVKRLAPLAHARERPPSWWESAASATLRCSCCASSDRAPPSRSTPMTGAAGSRPSSEPTTSWTARRARRGARDHGRPRRRHRPRLRRHRPVARRLAGHARPRRHLLHRRLRRHGHGPLGRAGRRRGDRRWATSSAPGSTSGRSCSCTAPAASC